MGRYVQAVVTRDTGRDLTHLINNAVDTYGFDGPGFVGGLLQESSLDEHSQRNGVPHDVSHGLSHQTVYWAGAEIPVPYRNADGTVPETPLNRAAVRDWLWDAGNAIPYTAKRIAAHIARYAAGLSPTEAMLEAWCRWNKPSIPGSQNPARTLYAAKMAIAERYAAVDEPPAEEDTTVALPVSDERAHWADLTKHQYGSYDRRSLASVTRAVVHYSDGNRDAGPQQIYDWQTGWGAYKQTGTGMPFPNIAYSFVVDGAGAVHWIHDLSLTTWHGGNANSTSFSVMFTGASEATDAQKRGIATAIAFGEQQLGRTVAILGHQDVNSTQCPGDDWPNWRAALERAVADIRNGSPVVAPPAPGVDPTGGKTMLPGSTMPQYIREQGLGAAFTDETPCLGGSLLYAKDGSQVYTVLYRAYTKQLKHLAW